MIPTGFPLLALLALAWVALTATWACGWATGHHAARRHPAVRTHQRRRAHLRVVDPDPTGAAPTDPAPYDWQKEESR